MASEGLPPRPGPTGAEVKQLAARGAVVVGLRGIASRLVALGGTVVLARSLSVTEFGIFALGATLVTTIAAVVQAGLGAGLIRRERDPDRIELENVAAANGLMIAGAVLVTTVACAWIGGDALFVAAMVAALPVTAFRAPGVILFERALSYRRLAQVEILETVALYGLGAGLVLAGLGLTGVAIAAAVRAVGGTLLILRVAPRARVRPRLTGRVIRDLAGFAGRYQGVALVNFARDQGVNLGIAAVGGIAMLGDYTIASRLIQAPQIFLQALFRVSYPAMARLRSAGEDARNVIERTLAGVALGTGLIVAPLAAASAPLVTVVFGERWSGAAAVIPPTCAGLMIGGPVAVSAAGYLFAADAAGVVLRSAILHTLTWFAVTLPLLGPIGVLAAGIGTLATSIVEGLVLGRAVSRGTGARVLPALAVPLLAAVLAGAAGTASIAFVSLGDALEAALAAVTAGVTFSLLALALSRDDLVALLHVARGARRTVPA